MPRAMAAAACSAWTSKLDPPTWVESVHAGWMPRYSASSIDGAKPVPVAEATPSTSAKDKPASSNASLIIWASAALPLMSSSPVGDTASAAPTTAARPRRLIWSREAMCPLLFLDGTDTAVSEFALRYGGMAATGKRPASAASPNTPRPGRGDTTGTAVREAARQVFTSGGSRAAPVDGIAAAAGFPKGAFYRHFSSKA